MSQSYSSSSYYYSSSSADDGTTESGQRYATTSHTEPDGTKVVRTIEQGLGEPAILEERRFDPTGRQLTAGDSSAGGVRRIEDVDEEGA
ncbi:hypothetical protein BDV25DRAFT_73536 [Aspergillus avenaceus]|uniref:Uncharacterized protein n=1 Tax=Aspergillus avenaceus TaxID=36643 RepID=A0A5N6U0W6_ASPAV|nr:hypothetical protein BDV25DRAFT_73536 [Aspergillus avenaceus]